ncbi:SHOCT domain-containing protein [Nitrobacter sp.]|uniref:SHOCT domain-containing protein n=1 Tax=Nitrobacter sp. TaxID=29420 RepID=UPI0029CAC08B|nr:SHOCT domain-containing protein [Nitrobacter sp.]
MVTTAGGAIHPPLVTLAAPYVCDGTVETQSQNYSYRPGQHGVARHILCLDPDGGRRDVTLRAIGAATIYYTLIFLPIGLLLGIAARRWVRSRLSHLSATVGSQDMAHLKSLMADRLRIDADIPRRPATPPDTSGENIADRLRHLQSLRDGNLISEEEYQAKHAETLADL